MTIWHTRIASWIPKATDTHSEYVIRIALPLQQWLNERVSLLHYTHIECLVICSCPATVLFLRHTLHIHPLYQACAYYDSVRHILTLLWTLHASHSISPLPPTTLLHGAVFQNNFTRLPRTHTSGRQLNKCPLLLEKTKFAPYIIKNGKKRWELRGMKWRQIEGTSHMGKLILLP